MRSKDSYESAYIICKFLTENIQYLSGTFRRTPIFKRMTLNYSESDLKGAFEFLNELGILKSSINESKGLLVIYGRNSMRMEMFMEMYWKESSYESKKKCRKILEHQVSYIGVTS